MTALPSMLATLLCPALPALPAFPGGSLQCLPGVIRLLSPKCHLPLELSTSRANVKKSLPFQLDVHEQRHEIVLVPLLTTTSVNGALFTQLFTPEPWSFQSAFFSYQHVLIDAL
jgi:hypothetical protein